MKTNIAENDGRLNEFLGSNVQENETFYYRHENMPI